MKKQLTDNPIDVVESRLIHQGWLFERCSSHYLSLESEGASCGYHIAFRWHQPSLVLSCTYETRVLGRYKKSLSTRLSQLNAHLTLGRLELDHHGTLSWCYTLPQEEIGSHNLLSLVEVALSECEGLYPSVHTTPLELLSPVGTA